MTSEPSTTALLYRPPSTNTARIQRSNVQIQASGQQIKLNDNPHRSSTAILLLQRGRVLQGVQIERPHPRQQIHLVGPDEEAALVPRVNLPENVKRDDNGTGEIFLEEECRVGEVGAARRL